LLKEFLFLRKLKELKVTLKFFYKAQKNMDNASVSRSEYNPTELLTGYSKAMHSTWFYYKPNNLLFDCGEGVCLELSSKIYGIKTILLSHGHLDHIMGLPGLFFIRSSGRGDNEKPLHIIYPKGDKDIVRIREFIDKNFLPPYELSFQVTWTEVNVGDSIPLGDKRYANVFATRHDSSRLTVGYQIMEKRKTLKKEFIELTGNDIKNKINAGEDVLDINPRNILTYTGDTTVQNVAEYEQAELLIHECTFLNRDEVKYDSHSVLEDVLKCVVKYNPKNLLLNHFSVRYSPAMCSLAVKTLAKEMKLPFPVWIQYAEHCWCAYNPTEE
jgi:ribonuclease Z